MNLLKNENKRKESQEKDVEEILEKTWKNWESRRRCEKTHVPEYLKHKNENE